MILSKNDIDLSIVIPVYNCANFLKNGFEFLIPLYNFNINFEIIYVNDGSTDDSGEILDSIAKTHINITIIHQENQGSSGARNTAIEIAKGAFIQFLDADDYLDVNLLEKFVNKAAALNVDCLGYRMDFVNENGSVLGAMTKHSLEYDKVISGHQALIDGYQPSSICVFLFKRSFLNENNLRIYPKITHMDVEFMTRFMMVATSVLFMDKIAYHYLQREGSITKPNELKTLEKFLYDEVIVAELIKNNLKNKMSKELKLAIQKNYNSVVWNLLWRFITKPKEVSLTFKLNCIAELNQKKLYPIKGELKTTFQNISRYFMNSWIFRGVLLKVFN